MGLNNTFYEVLGVPRDATREQIRLAYREKAKECHPDKHSNGSERSRKAAEMAFRSLTDVYDVLYYPDRRRAYDESIAAASIDDVIEGDSAKYDALMAAVYKFNELQREERLIGLEDLSKAVGLKNTESFSFFCNDYKRIVKNYFDELELAKKIFSKDSFDWRRVVSNAAFGLLAGFALDYSNPLVPLSTAAAAGMVTAADEKLTNGASNFKLTAAYSAMAAVTGLILKHTLGYEEAPYIMCGTAALISFVAEAALGTMRRKKPGMTIEQRDTELYENFKKKVTNSAKKYSKKVKLRTI